MASYIKVDQKRRWDGKEYVQVLKGKIFKNIKLSWKMIVLQKPKDEKSEQQTEWDLLNTDYVYGMQRETHKDVRVERFCMEGGNGPLRLLLDKSLRICWMFGYT